MILALILASYAFVDRPFATWIHDAPSGLKTVSAALTHFVDPLPLFGVAALIAAAWSPPGAVSAKPVLAASIAILLAMLLKEQAKYAFGRTWPETWVDGNPSWIASGVFEFRPFHGGRGWASFPSGHMTLVTAPAFVLWRQSSWDRWVRWAGPLAVILVALGLLGADYHFLSDVFGGILLGAFCGSVAMRVTNRPSDGTGKAGDQNPPQSACRHRHSSL